MKRVVPRALAWADVERAVAHYRDSERSVRAALGFIDALEQAFGQISRAPAIGSPRYDHELNLPGLRFWSLRNYPYLVFYVEQGDRIDVWRVLHGRRDIPATMHDDP